MSNPLFTNILQVGIVVKDLDEAVKRYWHQYGIGPWAIYDFNPKTVKEMIIHGKPAQYSMRLAMTFVGNVEIELMEPKDDMSIYAEFLKEHGEGLHHLAVDTPGYNQTVDFFEKKGLDVLQGGLWETSRYSYFDTLNDLGFITEIYDEDPDFQYPEPDAIYPPGATLSGYRYAE